MATVVFDPAQIRAGGQVVTPWLTVALEGVGGGSRQTLRLASLDIAEQTNGGQKLGLVLDWPSVSRRIDFRDGGVTQQDFEIGMSDIGRQISTLLDSSFNRFWYNADGLVEIIGSAGRSALNDPLPIARGKLVDLSGEAQRWALRFGGVVDLDEKFPKRLISTDQFSDAPLEVQGLVEPIIYGNVTDVGWTDVGALPTIYVGTEVISSTTWHRFLVAGHACKAVDQVYSGGTLISAGQYGVDVLAPGHGSWPFGTVYRDIGGRRYTLIYARGPVGDNAVAGTSLLTVNVQGVEANADGYTGSADGSGTLVTDVVKQFRHFLVQYVLNDYQSGSWLGIPIWSVQYPTIGKLEPTSFDAVSTALGVRLGGGYTGGGAVGFDGQKALSEHMKDFLISIDSGLTYNSQGQIVIYTTPSAIPGPGTATPVATYTDQHDLIGPVRIRHEPDRLYNDVPYVYEYFYANDQAPLGARRVSSSSQTAYRVTRQCPERSFKFLRTSAVASNCASAFLARHADPPRRVRFTVPVYGLHSDVGQVVAVTTIDGTGSGGWASRLVLVDAMDVNLEDLTVDLEGYDWGYTPVGGDASAAYTSGQGAAVSGAGVGTVDAVAVSVLAGTRSLGGTLGLAGHRVNGVEDVWAAPDITIDWSIFSIYTVKAYVWGYTENASASWKAEIWDVVSGAPNALVAADTAQTNTTRSERTVTIPPSTGVKTYRLRVRGVSANDTIYCMGELRVEP